MQNTITMYRAITIIALLMILPSAAALGQQKPWFFAVLSDPQMGMYASDRNFEQETANLEFVVANLNRLHPRFVVICGDLVNRTADQAEIAEYKRILRRFDSSIPVYNVAGNHDVGNVPTAATLQSYNSEFGPDYYTFSAPGMLGIVLDSNLIRSPEGDAAAAQKQEAWLKGILASAKLDQDRQPVVFQHIPYFVHDPAEAVNYFNIPQPARQIYLGLFENAGVKYIFAGHLHRPIFNADGGLDEAITGAVGRPLGRSVSGFTIVRVDGHKLDSQWYCLGGIPNTINPEQPLPETCRSEKP